MSDPFSTPRDLAPAALPRKTPADPVQTDRARTDHVRTDPVRTVAAKPAPEPVEVPSEFGFETEHPVVAMPFKVQFGESRLDGIEISVTAAYVAIAGKMDPAWIGHKEFLKIQFDFQGFSVSIFPEVMVAAARRDGEMTLQFLDPAGAHLPQLRYVLNSYIAGDFVSLGGLMAYSGPTQPRIAKSAEGTASKFRIRSLAVAVMSLTLIVVAANVILNRYTQSYEQRPVFVERLGNEMRASAAGQVAFLNPAAKKGEVVFSINSNTGDVLSFQLPCDCEVSVTKGIFVGATVLPIDSILSFFGTDVQASIETQMSIEGLARAMGGDKAYLDMADGRTIPVQVVATSATTAAALQGDLFVPVDLVPDAGVLGPEDIGKAAKLRLSRSWLGDSFPNVLEKS